MLAGANKPQSYNTKDAVSLWTLARIHSKIATEINNSKFISFEGNRKCKHVNVQSGSCNVITERLGYLKVFFMLDYGRIGLEARPDTPPDYK